MEQQVRRSDRLAAVGELAAGMAHEIRNPLASLSGSITMLREELQLEGMGRELMEIVTGEISRLDALITDFLGFASPREPLVCRTDLGALARETATLLRQAHQGPWRVEVVEQGRSPGRGRGRSGAGAAGLLEPLAQCHRSDARGGAARDHRRRRADAVTVAFADSGGGIPAAAMPKIFTPFFSTKERGTGLGLAIVFKIVEAHRGRVDVESSPGRGTTVRVVFPVRQPRSPGGGGSRGCGVSGGAAHPRRRRRTRHPQGALGDARQGGLRRFGGRGPRRPGAPARR